jgi:hypothetical protein
VEYAEKAQQLKPDYWYFPYIKGKLFEILDKPPESYLQLYYDAYQPTKPPKERSVESFYRLHASRLKLLKSGKADLTLLSKFMCNEVLEKPVDAPALTCDQIYEDIMQAMITCRVLDPYFHKSVYMEAREYRFGTKPDSHKSRARLKLLFSDKKTAKDFFKFWRQQPYRGGKYDYYCNKYTSLYIQLLEETQEIDLLEIVCYRLKRESSSISQSLYRKSLMVFLSLREKSFLKLEENNSTDPASLEGMLRIAHQYYVDIAKTKYLDSEIKEKAASFLEKVYRRYDPASSNINAIQIKQKLKDKYKLEKKSKIKKRKEAETTEKEAASNSKEVETTETSIQE